MDPELILNLLNGVLILGISFPSLYVAAKIEMRGLRAISILLASFLVVHGLYHLVAALAVYSGSGAYEVLSEAFVEPFSYLVLLGFALFLYRMRRV